MKVIILSGCSGSGKSTFANKIREAIGVSLVAECSADGYFMRGGKYEFNPAELTAAHSSCLRYFVNAIGAGTALRHEVVIVDNTNTTTEEIAPYYALAQAYGYEVELHTFLVEPAIAATRNTHGVPFAACEAMANRINQRKIPPFWKMKVVVHR